MELPKLDSFKEKAGPMPIWLWSVLIGGGGYLLYRHYQNKSASSSTSTTADTTTQDLTTGGTDYGPALLTAEYGLTNSLGILDSNVASNTTATVANTNATTADTIADKTQVAVTSTAPQIAQHGKYFIIPGKLDQPISSRTVAALLLPPGQRGQANAVELELRRLVQTNPSIKGKEQLPGGHKLIYPNSATKAA